MNKRLSKIVVYLLITVMIFSSFMTSTLAAHATGLLSGLTPTGLSTELNYPANMNDGDHTTFGDLDKTTAISNFATYTLATSKSIDKVVLDADVLTAGKVVQIQFEFTDATVAIVHSVTDTEARNGNVVTLSQTYDNVAKIHLRAADASVNIYEVEVYEYVVPPADTTAPATPVNLIATAADGSVELNWDDNLESDLAGYNVYQDSVKINASTVLSSAFSVTGLTNGTTYSFQVSAIDTTGNESALTLGVSATPSTGAFTVNLVPNETSITVQVTGGTMPYTVKWGELAGETASFSATSYTITGLTSGTSYTVTVSDSATTPATYTQTVTTTIVSAYNPPTMPDSTSLFQKMLNAFGTAGEIAIAVIGGAVALGVVMILGMWGWRLAKKWLSASK